MVEILLLCTYAAIFLPDHRRSCVTHPAAMHASTGDVRGETCPPPPPRGSRVGVAYVRAGEAMHVARTARHRLLYRLDYMRDTPMTGSIECEYTQLHTRSRMD